MAYKPKRLNRSLGSDVFIFSVITFFALLMALPLVYAIVSSLKPVSELWLFPPRFFVSNPTLRNFSDLFSLMSDSYIPFSRYIFNTLFISAAGTAGHVIAASLCAYAICKMRFYGSRVLFKIIVLSLMFNASVAGTVSFIIISRLHMMDNYAAVILPAFASSLGLYLMKQFMEGMVNDTLIEAAKIDGAGDWRIFWRIVMPMVRPAWLTLIIFSFQGLWNTGASVYIQSEELKTLNYAISQIVSGGIARAGVGAAATVLMMIVPIMVFVITQSNVVETMSASGMKD